MPKKQKWNKRIRQARDEIGFSLSQVTKILLNDFNIKIDPSHIAKIERGEISCRVELFKAFCDIYDVSADWALGLKNH